METINGNYKPDSLCLNYVLYLYVCNSQNKLGETPLHVAAKYGHIKVVKLLLEKGASVQIKVSYMPSYLLY